MAPAGKRYYNFEHRRNLNDPHINTPGVIRGNHKIVNADYDVQINDSIIVCDSPVDINIYLWCAMGYWSQIIIKNIGLGIVHIIPCASPANLIDSAPSEDLAQWDSMTLIDYIAGSWIIV